MWIPLSRKYDYASWDKNGNPTINSRYFKFENLEIVVNFDHILITLYNNKECTKHINIIKISNGKFQFDNENSRIILNIIKDSEILDDKISKVLYITIGYYKNFYELSYSDEDIFYYYIISKYAYDRKGKWNGVNRTDIDNFYKIIKYHTYLKFPSFNDIIKDYNKKHYYL